MITRRALLSAAAPMVAAGRKRKRRTWPVGWQQNLFPLVIVTAGPGFQGVFGYDPGPGPGNLVFSDTSHGGTDPYGNAFLGGQANYFNAGAGYVAVNINSGTITFYSAATEAGPWAAGASISGFASPGGIGQVQLILQQSANAAFLDNADLHISTIGRGLQVAEGANARMGTGTLASGTVTIANTSVTANTRAFITMRTHGPNSGFVSVAVNPGVGFTVSSSNAADGNSFNWLLVEAL